MANLGQVAGLFVGTSAPTNTNLIWFDSTVSVKYHKVYNFDLNVWEKLNKSSISNKTYSELVTLATGSGLSLGAQYYITNLDVLAVAITATKVNYFDANGNLVVDDLGSAKSYIVSSANLIIDDITGAFDVDTQKVEFTFQIDTFDGEDYAHSQGTRTSVLKLLKYKWKTIVSSKANNSIVWDGGIYFNLKAALAYIFDKSGGVVSYETFVTSNTTLSNQLLALSNNYQNFANNANQTIETGLAPANFYSKQIPEAINTSTAPADIAVNDSLFTILSKIQRFINKFKRADGILVSASFAPSTSDNLNIINTDTVDNALRKIQAKIKNSNVIFSLQSDLNVVNNRWLPNSLTSADSLNIYCADLSDNWNTVTDVMSIWNNKTDYDANSKPLIQVVFKKSYFPKEIKIIRISDSKFVVVHVNNLNVYKYSVVSDFASDRVLKVNLITGNVYSETDVTVPGSTKIQNNITLHAFVKEAATAPVTTKDQLGIYVTSSIAVTSSITCNVKGIYSVIGSSAPVNNNLSITSGGSTSSTTYLDDLETQGYFEQIQLWIDSITPSSDSSSDFIKVFEVDFQQF